MNRTARLVAIAVAAWSAWGVSARSERLIEKVPSPTYTIGVAKASFAAGEPILVDVTITNDASMPVEVHGVHGIGFKGTPYEFRIRKVHSRHPPHRRDAEHQEKGGKTVESKGVGAKVAIRGARNLRLEPQQSFADQLSVSDYYDMSAPGRYEVQLVRRAGEEIWQTGVPISCPPELATYGTEASCVRQAGPGDRVTTSGIRWARAVSNVIEVVVKP